MGKKNGFRKFPNDTYRVFMKADLTRAELKVMLAIFDVTLGWQREEGDSSLSDIGKKINITHKAVIDALKSLESRHFISVVAKGMNNHSKTTYHLHHYEEWLSKEGNTPSEKNKKYTSSGVGDYTNTNVIIGVE